MAGPDLGTYGEAPTLRPRTYSDPELPQLLPLPVRPSSSYEVRPKVQSHVQFDEEIIERMARRLGLDVDRHAEFRWIIRDCLLALNEDGWSCELVHEDLEFMHISSGETRTDHHVVELHKKMAERLIGASAELKAKQRDPHYQIRHLVFKAIMGERDVRGVCDPQMIHQILDLIDVNVKEEPHLIRRVKYTVEDAYFRMKKIGAHRVTVENCIDVQSLVVNLELDRAGFLKKISPSKLLYCVQCSIALGDVISTGCHDVLCNACAVDTHSTGHRQDHPMVFLEQAVCSECERKAALVRCQDCVDLFCYDCFQDTHRRGKRARHCVSLPTRTFCFECDSREAAYICVECEDALCTRCSARMHRQGARQNHTLFGLRKVAYNKKLFASNLDRLMGIIQRNVERSFDLSPWFIFYDASLAPYWYNFQLRVHVRADPGNLTRPPMEAESTASHAEDERPAHELEPDEQLQRGLPGATDLLSTHIAKYAAEGAVFDVPPPVHIRFQSAVTAGTAGISGRFGGGA